MVLVNLKTDAQNTFYVYQYNDFVERVNKVYKQYINTPKKDGGTRKDVDFRWYDYKDFTDDS